MCTTCAQSAIALSDIMTQDIGNTMVAQSSGNFEAASGIARVDVEPVNARSRRDLYAKAKKIYPKLAFGKFRLLKWVVMVVTLGIYYTLPWLRWNRGPTLPNQAFLIDFEHQRLYFGPLEIWPQEFYLITGLLVLSALTLFLVTALAGRVWCGYACPQTVWTDLMIAVERFWQGDRNARMRLDASPWNANKILRKGATHISWLLVGLATGGAFVFYFRDAPTLAREFAAGTAPVVAWLFLGIFSLTTYLLGGIAREQVCTYMCPWPRIQGAMFDADSFLVSYRPHRGEPRGAHKKSESWEGRGDCVDCQQCVVVCPMGIDIRDGPQLECIQCALCIDACNSVMTKVGRPNLLIAYDTFHNLDAVAHGTPTRTKLIRPRTVLYAGSIVIVGGLMLAALWGRTYLAVTVQPDRNPLFVRLTDNSIRNGYTVKILNKWQETRHFRIGVEGLPGAVVSVAGVEQPGGGPIDVPASALREVRVFVAVPPESARQLPGEATDFNVLVTDLGDASSSRHTTSFRRPTP